MPLSERFVVHVEIASIRGLARNKDKLFGRLVVYRQESNMPQQMIDRCLMPSHVHDQRQGEHPVDSH